MSTITVNGTRHAVHAPSDTPLLYVLRNELELIGPQFGCGLAQCGVFHRKSTEAKPDRD